jgi:hypothetical protein
MSVSAIKAFFERTRNPKKFRQVEVVEEVIEEPQVPVEEVYYQEIYNVLGLKTVLEEDTPEEEESEDVEIYSCGKNLPLKVGDLTDEIYGRLLIEKSKKITNEAKRRAAELPVDPRPAGKFDEELKSLKEDIHAYEQQLAEVRKELEKTVGNGKFMPSAKKKVLIDENPEITTIQNAIEKSKNEIKKIEVRIEELNNEWDTQQRLNLQREIEEEIEMSGL